MNNLPEFKQGFKYDNLGNLVGDLVYAKEATRKDGSVFGMEFLINVKGFGSCNVRIPKVDTAQASLAAYSVEAKPKVRVKLTRVEQFTSQKGDVYTSFTSFVELDEPKKVNGEEMDYKVAGRVAGELFNIRQEGEVVRAHVVTYPMEREGKVRAKSNQTGQFVDPQVLLFEAHKPEVAQQILQAGNGANVEIGYYYYNKQDIQQDDFGMAVGTGKQIQRLEIGRVDVKKEGQAQQGNFGGSNQQGNPFGNQGGQTQQQGSPFGAPQNNQQQQGGQQQGGNPWGNPQQQQNQAPPQQNQQQQQSNPWGAPNGQQQQQQTNNDAFQSADQHFQQNQGNENSYPFGGQEVNQNSPFGGNPWGDGQGQGQGGNGFPFGS